MKAPLIQTNALTASIWKALSPGKFHMFEVLHAFELPRYLYRDAKLQYSLAN
jgi:hypothetical protein